MKMTPDNDIILHAYNHLVENARMTLDLGSYWDFTTPAWLAACKMTCADGAEVKVSLVIDEDIATEKEYEYIRVRLGELFVAFPLQGMNPENTWFEQVENEDAKEKALSILTKVLGKDEKQLEQLMNNEGICALDRIIFTEKGLEKPMKIPATATLAAFGEVIHGVKGLDEYCKHQMDDASPYILKHTFTVETNRDDEFDDGIYRCCNYLLCQSKKEAEQWMRALVSLLHASVTEPNEICVSEEFPPLICYAKGLPYMVVCHKTME